MTSALDAAGRAFAWVLDRIADAAELLSCLRATDDDLELEDGWRPPFE